MSDFVIENGVLTNYTGDDRDVVIPEGVTSIGELAFTDCNSLIHITIPESVKKIGYWAFKNCTNLECIAIPKRFKSQIPYLGIPSTCKVTFTHNKVKKQERKL